MLHAGGDDATLAVMACKTSERVDTADYVLTTLPPDFPLDADVADAALHLDDWGQSIVTDYQETDGQPPDWVATREEALRDLGLVVRLEARIERQSVRVERVWGPP